MSRKCPVHSNHPEKLVSVTTTDARQTTRGQQLQDPDIGPVMKRLEQGKLKPSIEQIRIEAIVRLLEDSANSGSYWCWKMECYIVALRVRTVSVQDCSSLFMHGYEARLPVDIIFGSGSKKKHSLCD